MSDQEKSKEKKIGPYKRAAMEAMEKAGNRQIVEEGFVLHQYDDYETYRDVQIAGNKAKLRMQFVKESHIEILSNYLNKKFASIDFGICQGTRRGSEQAWFRQHLSGNADVIGTEISDTATEFPNTVQWDFHERNPEWDGRASFVYSNSWDHAYDPEKAFNAWIDTLKIGGVLLLDYTKGQSPEAANALDPFGISYEKLVELFETKFSGRGRLIDTIDTRRQNKEYRALVIVFERIS